MSKPKRTVLTKFNRQSELLFLLAPAFILAFVFSYIPLLGWIIAFKEYIIGQPVFTAKWVGFYNFIQFFQDLDGGLRALRNTVVTNILGIIIRITIPCVFAMLLNETGCYWYKRFVQTLTFFPFFVSPVIVYSIFYMFLSPSSGVINVILVNLGIVEKGIGFFTEPGWAWPLMLGISLWRVLGYNSVIYLAAISGIDQEQYDSAEIDGAGRVNRMLHITFPNIVPTIMVVLILSIGQILESDLNMNYLLTNLLNRDMMETLNMYIYRVGLSKMDFSYSTAVSIVLSVVSLIMVFSANKFSKVFFDRAII